MFTPILGLVAIMSLYFWPTSKEPTKQWSRGAADCWSLTTDIYAETNGNLNLTTVLPHLENQEQLVDHNIQVHAAGSPLAQACAAAPYTWVSGSYPMYFEYCQPRNGKPVGVFQKHHGLTANAGYWDFNVKGDANKYSFAEAAAEAGWATLSYDRLGVRHSAHPDGLEVVQIPYEAAQSAVINAKLRDGSLVKGVPPFNRVIGLGHSYGSAILVGLSAALPNAFDQIILTGFNANYTFDALGVSGFSPTIASVAYPKRFGHLSNDYLTTASISNDQLAMFHYPNYTKAALLAVHEGKSEYTLGQQSFLLSGRAHDRRPANKPVFVITGNNDAPLCTANCHVTSLGPGKTQLDTTKAFFPSVVDEDFETYAIPDTGHGVNFRKSPLLFQPRRFRFIFCGRADATRSDCVGCLSANL